MADTRNGTTFREQLAADTTAAGGPAEPHPDDLGSVGKTLFDLPGSTDLTVTVVVPKNLLHAAPAQSLVRIVSRTDGRKYLGVVTAGPFAEPDGLRGDSPMLTAVATHGGDYLPPYHGRIQVTILGEELNDGTLTPPRWRPLPNSPVFVLSDTESGTVLKCGGDLRLGLAAGHEGVVVGVPTGAKAVLPRHTAILGTTGGGKSNTVAGMVKRATDAGMAVILLDVEGEYTFLHEPTTDSKMCSALRDRTLVPAGVPIDRMAVYHLVGRDTANPDHPNRRTFSLQFAELSPYAVFEILGLSEPQQERFLKAYDIAKEVMRDLDIFPKKGNAEQERIALEVDEFDRGYPRMTLPILMDIVGACLARAESGGGGSRKGKKDDSDDEVSFTPWSRELATPAGIDAIRKRTHAANPPGNAISWRAVLGRLARLRRLNVFYDEANGVRPIIYNELLRPGQLTVVDLSDTGFSELNNLVIADLLRGVQSAQDDRYTKFEAGGKPPPRVLIVIEEAHEFLSDERIDKMPVLFQQVARIAKRGRKRWLGLAFVTQLPSHLPRQVLGLCNSFILHKLTDPVVLGNLKRTVGGVDDGLWDRLSGLAPGQAITSFPHFTRPLLVAIDAAPGKLRLADDGGHPAQ
jgi:DNA helicase HerA-like ATPase